MPDAVIFDCDGVLVDSEVIALRIELAYMTELGMVYDPHEYADRYLGTATPDFIGLLNEDHQRQLGKPLPDRAHAVLSERIQAEMDAKVGIVAGVMDVVQKLRLPKAIASGSSTAGLEKKLRKVALFDLFAPHIYSAELVSRGKPAPDVYLHAAAQLGIEPTACMAVEDSVNGTVSARAAGMAVIGFTGGGHCPPQQADRLRAAGAAHVVGHMDELLSLMEGQR